MDQSVRLKSSGTHTILIRDLAGDGHAHGRYHGRGKQPLTLAG